MECICIRPTACQEPLPAGKALPTHCVYLHGELNDELGNDLTDRFYNCEDVKYRRVPRYVCSGNGQIRVMRQQDRLLATTDRNEFFSLFYKEEIVLEGGYDVTVQGVNRPCFGFFHTKWTTLRLSESLKDLIKASPCGKYLHDDEWYVPEVQGLVVYKDNMADVFDAAKEYVKL